MEHVVEVCEKPARATGRWTGRIFSWSFGLACLSLMLGGVNIVIWANHWYVAEQVFYPEVDEAAKQGPYWDIAQLLRSGNEALLEGFTWLGVAALCGTVALVLGRRRRR
ncbi:MAG: hypothetical protein HGA44_11495 [Cellulomonadaceae bacterium]|nr:hypothetical protein [Cellulomonadaceae bacterium]